MKYFFIALQIFVLAVYCFANRNIIIKDFSKSNFEFINNSIIKANLPSECLEIDTVNIQKEQTKIFQTTKNLLESGKTYTATIKYTLANQQTSRFAKMQLKGIADNVTIVSYNLFASKT